MPAWSGAPHAPDHLRRLTEQKTARLCKELSETYVSQGVFRVHVERLDERHGEMARRVDRLERRG